MFKWHAHEKGDHSAGEDAATWNGRNYKKGKTDETILLILRKRVLGLFQFFEPMTTEESAGVFLNPYMKFIGKKEKKEYGDNVSNEGDNKRLPDWHLVNDDSHRKRHPLLEERNHGNDKNREFLREYVEVGSDGFYHSGAIVAESGQIDNENDLLTIRCGSAKMPARQRRAYSMAAGTRMSEDEHRTVAMRLVRKSNLEGILPLAIGIVMVVALTVYAVYTTGNTRNFALGLPIPLLALLILRELQTSWPHRRFLATGQVTTIA